MASGTRDFPATGPACLPERYNRPNLRRKDASAFLREMYGIELEPSTLAKYAVKGGGPEFHKVNRTVLYPVPSLKAWATAKLGKPRTTTSEDADDE